MISPATAILDPSGDFPASASSVSLSSSARGYHYLIVALWFTAPRGIVKGVG